MTVTATEKVLSTAEDLWQLPNDGQKYELAAGELFQMPPSGFLHGTVAGNLARLLGEHVNRHELGAVSVAEAGFKLRQNPDTVRAPDVAFVSKTRILEQGKPEKFWEGAPDLAVEVVSPNDRFDDVVEKVQEYLAAGARLVWVALPRSKSIMVYHPNGEIKILREGNELQGEDVLPGFVCLIQEIFA
ncbi:MAG: Uma2 family endonuclease [Candidatus Binatia bacterium]